MSDSIGKAELHQYLTFRLDEEIFALDVSRVQEILDISTITKVPRSPDFMRGVINVRGSVVPVVDLRLKFDMPETERTVDTRIVVMEIAMEGDLAIIGTLADAVHNVMNIDPTSIEPPPKIGDKWNSEFIKGIGNHNETFIIILDMDRIFSARELAMVEESQKKDTAAP